MKRGITIVAMTTAVILIAIFVSVTVISASSIMENANRYKFVTEIINMQDIVDSYKTEHDVYPIYEKVNVDLSTLSEEAILQFSRELSENDQLNLYTIDYDLVNIKEKVFGNKKTDNDVYALSQNTGKVYYLEGIKYKGKKYYTINNDILSSFNSNYMLGENDIKRLDVVFSSSNINYTNAGISVDVKIPENATFEGVIVTNSIQISGEVSEGDYKIMTVNDSKSPGNYKINVIYSLNGVTKSVWYQVDNFDNTDPEISYGNIVVSADEGGVLRTYVTNIKATDDLSGVKQIKYECENISDNKYFEGYGSILDDDKIDVTGKTSLSIYAIDNAGNEIIEAVALD